MASSCWSDFSLRTRSPNRVLQPNYLLSQLQAINILPGEAAQPLHCDDDWYPMSRPRPPHGAATVMAIDGFTADNGATRP